MGYGSSTFKFSSYSKGFINQNLSAVIRNLNFQTSTFGINIDFENCEEYYSFLEELKKIHSKVDSGDLSDFTE